MNPPYLCTEKKRKEGKGVEGRQRKETGAEEREKQQSNQKFNTENQEESFGDHCQPWGLGRLYIYTRQYYSGAIRVGLGTPSRLSIIKRIICLWWYGEIGAFTCRWWKFKICRPLWTQFGSSSKCHPSKYSHRVPHMTPQFHSLLYIQEKWKPYVHKNLKQEWS